jgi:hypothetical protein
MHDDPLQRYANDALEMGLAFLVDWQSSDGLWRDYDLKPGKSESWSTSWVGWCLSHFADRRPLSVAVRKAAVALVGLCTPAGWGYNRSTQADADSTAWALRFLSMSGIVYGPAASARLACHLDLAGSAHTFRDAAQGTWADAHADVTGIVGLALLACRGRRELVERIRSAVLSNRRPDGLWNSFWWSTDIYATLWSISFLRRSGGVPKEVHSDLEAWISVGRTDGSPLELALSLQLCLEIGAAAESLAEVLVHQLVDSFRAPSWPGSALLLVPERYDGDTSSPVGPHADEHGFTTTAMACVALARWVHGV